MKKNCCVKLKSSNIMKYEGGSMNNDWEKCFMAKTTTVSAMTSVNFEDD